MPINVLIPKGEAYLIELQEVEKTIFWKCSVLTKIQPFFLAKHKLIAWVLVTKNLTN